MKSNLYFLNLKIQRLDFDAHVKLTIISIGSLLIDPI